MCWVGTWVASFRLLASVPITNTPFLEFLHHPPPTTHPPTATHANMDATLGIINIFNSNVPCTNAGPVLPHELQVHVHEDMTVKQALTDVHNMYENKTKDEHKEEVHFVYALFTMDGLLAEADVLPRERLLFLVSRCWYDPEDPTKGEWRQRIEATMADIASGKWGAQKKDVEQLRRDVAAAGLDFGNGLRELTTVSSRWVSATMAPMAPYTETRTYWVEFNPKSESEFGFLFTTNSRAFGAIQ